ncbi:hypothetical protein L917_19590 [Phytophthora nicotianae]|uniref:Uncharacterized protein n=1 Tax=Phytophthora nicotianae TaxID=4792 RepID=W2K420_PHYNI|nr:hypothetical protein L917_19590 [Phytophthora nicotianae]
MRISDLRPTGHSELCNRVQHRNVSTSSNEILEKRTEAHKHVDFLGGRSHCQRGCWLPGTAPPSWIALPIIAADGRSDSSSTETFRGCHGDMSDLYIYLRDRVCSAHEQRKTITVETEEGGALAGIHVRRRAQSPRVLFALHWLQCQAVIDSSTYCTVEFNAHPRWNDSSSKRSLQLCETQDDHDRLQPFTERLDSCN